MNAGAKPTFAPIFAPVSVLSAAIGLACASNAFAQEANPPAAPAASVTTLAPIQTQGDGVLNPSPYQAETVQSGKFTQPLLDTPQSITVVPKAVLEEQQAQSLQDVLRNVPGITFTSGEGNLGWGDMFTIRGFSAEQSITVDGVRDAGMASRNDLFDLETAEVFKGTGSIESGVAAVGGSVNLVSKQARLGSFYKASTTLGTDNYRRYTTDLNQQLSDTSAFRLNLMRHSNDVAARRVTDYDRWGAAGSLALGLGTPTRVTIDFLHQYDDNIPDGGVPIQRGTNGERMPGVARNAWYGDPGLYKDRTKTDRATVRVEHDFSSQASLTNISRWEQTDRLTVLSPARFNSAAGTSLGYVGVGPLVTSASGIASYGDYGYDTSGSTQARLRGSNYGTSKRYTILANQTNLKLNFDTAGLRHDLVTGVEVYRERYGDLARWVDAPATNPLFDLRSGGGVNMGSVSTLEGGDGNHAEVVDVGLYVGDTVTLSPNWLVSGALRYDHFSVDQVSGGATSTTRDGAWSGKVGLTYKPVDYGSIYVSYSQAAQPSAIGASTNNNIYGATSSTRYKPAVSRTYELGSKWDLLEDRSLSLTGAVFRTELSDSWDYGDGTSVVRSLPAKEVHGAEIGLSGNLTSRLSAFAGVSVMKSRITKGANEGQEAKNVPDATFNLWASYAATDKLSFSYGVQYVGKRRYTDNKYVGGQNNNSSTVDGPAGKHPIYVEDDEKAPAYWVHSIAARYKIDKHFSVGVNVNNLFNRYYYSQIGSSLDGYQIYGVPGAGRTVLFTVDAKF
ncbi:TonB-dependent siderophore receptor [Bordetella sp. N]|uniref:TonB-dependent receptor n=1 Tax=Bordetella sp. N TaxID=1746199 RepID=UPI0007091C53|nr:TonB-dependent siderophore receptor [Bordetella sp. N]ALM81904.1 TonB-dependent receptor [Bordetella sp. N]